VNLDLTITNLAERDRDGSGHNLRLTVAQSGDNSRLDNRGANNLAVGNLRGSVFAAARADNDGDRLTLLGPVLVVQVVEGTRKAAVEGLAVAKGEDVVLANGEAAGEQGTGLSRLVELELVVRGDVANAVLSILGGTVLKGHDEDTSLAALSTLLDLGHEITLLGDLGHSDLEGAIKGASAAGRSRTGGGELVGDALGHGNSEAHEGRRGNDGGLHLELLRGG
jgi:hypothetical protein